MATLTQVNIQALTTAANEQAWNDACDAIKREHGGYPSDWWPRVMASGLADTVQSTWTRRAPAPPLVVNGVEVAVLHLDPPKAR